MAETLDQARKQRELSKQALTADLDRLEARLRTELDLKTRLRRDGPRMLAFAGGAVLLVGAIVVLRSRLGGGKRRRAQDRAATYDDLVAELREIHKSLDKKSGKKGSLPQKVLLRAVSAAGAAAGSVAVRQVLARQQPERREETPAARGR